MTEVTWLGHSTVLIELDGTRILTDPLLRSHRMQLVRTSARPVRPKNLDAVLISHAHLDHFDRTSLRKLDRETCVVVPRGLRRFVKAYRFEELKELDEGEEVEVGNVRIASTHAEHGGLRGIASLGYRIEGTQSIYFAGDTDQFDAMASLAPLDLVLLPISGWGPRLPPGHLNAESAARALQLLRPRIAVPIHWGTFRPFYRRKPYPDDASASARFVELAAQYAPEVEVRVLQPAGDPLVL